MSFFEEREEKLEKNQNNHLEITLRKSWWERFGAFVWGSVKILFLIAIVASFFQGSEMENLNSNIVKVYKDPYFREKPADATAKKIAVLSIYGAITSQKIPPAFGEATTNSEDFVALLADAAEDNEVSALLLRIDSPGGELLATENITKMVNIIQSQMQKPVFAVLENMAASGGYYIASSSDKIFAFHETLLGNIGVRMDIPNVQGLLDKVGVKMTNVTSSPMKDMGSPFREMTEEEKKIFEVLIAESYDQFVNRVAEGRKMPREDVLKLADGRIFSGKQAKENKLIDETISSWVELSTKLSLELGSPVQFVEFSRTISPWEEFLMTVGTAVSPIKATTEKLLSTRLMM